MTTQATVATFLGHLEPIYLSASGVWRWPSEVRAECPPVSEVRWQASKKDTSAAIPSAEIVARFEELRTDVAAGKALSRAWAAGKGGNVAPQAPTGVLTPRSGIVAASGQPSLTAIRNALEALGLPVSADLDAALALEAEAARAAAIAEAEALLGSEAVKAAQRLLAEAEA